MLKNNSHRNQNKDYGCIYPASIYKVSTSHELLPLVFPVVPAAFWMVSAPGHWPVLKLVSSPATQQHL